MMIRRLRGWRLRSLLIAVALLAAMLGWLRFEMTKPHPIGYFSTGATLLVIWSDHESHEDGRGYPVDLRSGRILTFVDWSDGSTTYYLHWPE